MGIYNGDIATTPDGMTVVVVKVTEHSSCFVKEVLDGHIRPPGTSFIVATDDLTRAFVPREQARQIYAEREGVDLETFGHAIPDFPIGTEEYHEYHRRLRTELRKGKLEILEVEPPDSKAYKSAEEFLNNHPPKV